MSKKYTNAPAELMSKEEEAETTTVAEEQTEDNEAKETFATEEKNDSPLVYCGPTVRGVAKQYTVFAGGIPQVLADFITKHPAAKGLVVPTNKFAETRKKVETAGTAEAILYQKIKREL